MIGFVACCSALFVVGVSLTPLLTPFHTRVVAAAFEPAERTGLSEERSLEIAEDVRRFVTRSDAEDLPAEVDGRSGFDDSAVSHLVDVREVLFVARGATGLTAGALTLVMVFALSRRRREYLIGGLRGGAWLLLASVTLVGAAALTDFSSLFARFHGVFFESGTWTFSNKSLLIQLFPEGFWVTSGALWAAIVLCGAGALWWLGGYASRRIEADEHDSASGFPNGKA